MDGAMQIVMLLAPNIEDSLYTGIAVGKNGRRYLFNATPDGASHSVLRQDPCCALPGDQCIWWQVEPPPALRTVVRSAVRRFHH
jgi:hypothetical protein